MNHVLRRKIFILSIMAVVAGLLIYGFLPKTRDVDIVFVTRGPLQVTIEEEGRTRLKDRFTISAPTAGYLQRIHATKWATMCNRARLLQYSNPCSRRRSIPAATPQRGRRFPPPRRL